MQYNTRQYSASLDKIFLEKNGIFYIYWCNFHKKFKVSLYWWLQIVNINKTREREREIRVQRSNKEKVGKTSSSFYNFSFQTGERRSFLKNLNDIFLICQWLWALKEMQKLMLVQFRYKSWTSEGWISLILMLNEFLSLMNCLL